MASSASLLTAMWRTRLPGMGRAPVARSSACENGFTLPPRGPARVPRGGAPGYRTRCDRRAPRRMTIGGRVLGVGEFLVVEVVQQADETPRLGILAEFGGISPHRGLDREHVLAQRGRLRVLVHEGQGVGSVHWISTPHRSLH